MCPDVAKRATGNSCKSSIEYDDYASQEKRNADILVQHRSEALGCQLVVREDADYTAPKTIV